MTKGRKTRQLESRGLERRGSRNAEDKHNAAHFEALARMPPRERRFLRKDRD